MKTISIADLRTNFTNIMNQVKKGKSFIIDSNGKAVAHLIPANDRRKEAIAKLKSLRKTAIIGDIVSPTGEKWEAS